MVQKKGKIANILMALLLMLQVLVMPIGVISADTTTGASTVSGGLELFNVRDDVNRPTDIVQINDFDSQYKVAAKLNNQTGTDFDGGKIRIKLNRRDFREPTADGLAKPADNEFADKLASSQVITTDSKDWIIEYTLKKVSPGENLEIPSVVQSLNPNVDQTPGTINEEIVDSHDHVLTTASKNYKIDSRPVTGTDFSMWSSGGLLYYYNYQGKENQVTANDDGSYTTLADRKIGMYLSNSKYSFDSRQIVVTMDLSKLKLLRFDTDAPNGWTYDAATKKATRTCTYSALVDSSSNKRNLPLVLPKGTRIDLDQYGRYYDPLSYDLQYVGSKTPIVTGRKGNAEVSLKSGQNWNPRPDGHGVNNATGQNRTYVGDANAKTKVRYSVEAAGQIPDGGYQRIPAGVSLPVKALKGMLPTDFYQDNVLQGFSLKTGQTLNLPGMTNNHLYGINADGSEDLLKDNLGATPWDATQISKKYQGFELKFDQPIMVKNPDAAFGFNIIASITEKSIQDFRNNPSQLFRDYGLGKFYGNYHGYYQDEYEPGWSYNYFSLNKYNDKNSQPALIRSDDHSDQVSVVNGHDFTLKRSFYLQNNYANTPMENAKVYFLVPEHLRLAADQSGLQGLTNVQIISNFHNSGRTAITGDLTPVETQYGFTTHSISLSLDAAQLRQGDNYQIEGYVVYNNNDGSYDLSNPAGTKSIVTPKLASDPYQLYTDTKDPTKGLKLANMTLNYMPIAGLKVTNLVAKGDGGYSSDLGAYGYAGDTIKYRTNLYNGYSEVVKNIGLVDYLPVAGINGSKFDVKLAGPVTVTNKTASTASPIDYQQAFKVYYATTKPSYGAGDYSHSVIWRTQSQMAPTDYPKVTMVKMMLDPNIPFDPKAEVNFDYPAQMTSAATPENSQAINQVQLINGSGGYYNVNQAKVTMNYPVNAVQTTKVDSVSQKPLYGAQFRLLDSTGKAIGTQLYETNASGKFQISALKAGKYYLEEVAAPTGYILPQGDEAKTPFTIGTTANTPTIVKITNISKATPEGNVLIKNQDTATGKLLNGGSFSLNRVNAVGETTVDPNLVIKTSGQLSHAGLLPGKYRIRQNTAPNGYLLNSQAFDFTVNSGETSTVLVKNSMIPAPIKGQLTIINHEKNQPTKLIAGSEFELIDQSTGKQVGTKLITDKNGRIVQKDLPVGEYQLKQVSVPAGYVLNTDTQTVKISKDNPTITAKFENDLKPVTPVPVKGQLTVINHEKNQPTKLIAGSEFELIDQKTGKQVAGKLVTDKNGQIVQKDLPAGEYQLKQVSVPAGYVLNTESQTITISKDQPTVTTKFTNKLKPVTPESVKGQLTITNHEKNQPSKQIIGSEFELTDHSTGKRVAAKLVTDKNGQIVQKDLPAGEYQVKQVSVPAGYVLNTDTQTVKISKDNPTVTAKFENDLKPVTPVPVKGQLTVINHEKNQPTKLIAGSEFALIDSSTGKKVGEKLVTDKNGQIVQKDLPAGEYQLKQVAVPAGYVLNTESQTVKISKDTSKVTAKFENEAKSVTPVPVKGQLTIINHENNQPSKLIIGSKFELINQKTGKQVASKLVTGKNGQVVQKDLPAGEYQLKQVSVPAGYVLNTESQTITISKDQPTVTTKFTNDLKPVTPASVKGQLTIINHAKNQPSKLIAGSEFKLIDQNTGKQVAGKLVTDKNGQVMQANLPAGEYQLKQVSVPAGYTLNTESQTITISKDQPTVTAKFVNEAKTVTTASVKGQLTIINHEKNQPSKLIAGSEFALINQSTGKQVAGNLITDKNGQIVQKELPEGSYQLKQVSVPSGYLMNSDRQVVTISKDTPKVTIKVVNEAKPIVSKPTVKKPQQPTAEASAKSSSKASAKSSAVASVKSAATTQPASSKSKAAAISRSSKTKHLPQSNEQLSIGLLVLGILLLVVVLAYAWKKGKSSKR
ncbi:SpaA isopeptide-forming pilin-related protein [Lactiplantibacillus sp. WILCCON 0030]|uniref:SpaA isopeptide-forming pilin-related protein n=1 Tax=Lactiplantibacillus brownii TaxID=3069269 RepID=A0ABU1A7F9_9LACO|nr:SpaA isopeptide-forming pilin-related protein [Lactiplantibacillus brownii]MDQ7936882.1 SpaA isopeptide-forming pilin-related protein [Lactiplantibacillus brownii]